MLFNAVVMDFTISIFLKILSIMQSVHCSRNRSILYVARVQMVSKMLHSNLPGNNLYSSAVFPFCMNFNSNGEGPHQWNFNLIIYCLRQNINKNTHTILCAKKMG